MHRLLDDIKYKFDKKFDGCKEFFIDLDIDEFSKYLDEFEYSELLKGKRKMELDKYEAIVTATKAEQKQSASKGSDKLAF